MTELLILTAVALAVLALTVFTLREILTDGSAHPTPPPSRHPDEFEPPSAVRLA